MNKELLFKEELENLVYSFGSGSQEGVKEALRRCQEIFSMISTTNMSLISEFFNINPNIVKTLVKINKNLKESIVKYEVVCCLGKNCSTKGSTNIIKLIMDEFNINIDETTKDNLVHLSSRYCFKQCSKSPNLTINGTFYHNMNLEKTKDIINKIKKEIL